MTLSMAATVAQIRDLVAEVTTFERVYGEAETDGNALPASISQLPAAIVFAGNSIEYILSAGQHRHTYEVEIWLFIRAAGLEGNALSSLVAYQALIEKFVGNVALGSRANSCVFRRQEGPNNEEYGGQVYLVRKLVLEVSEQASAAPAVGS